MTSPQKPADGAPRDAHLDAQARAFLEQVAGLDRLPRVPSFEHGLRNLRLLQAITESALNGGADVRIS